MSRDEAASIELVFSRGPSESRRAKARELWKFLDRQSDLKPWMPDASKETAESKESPGDPPEKSAELTENSRYPWYEGLCVLRHLGLDRVALAAGDARGDRRRSLNSDNATRGDGRLADDTEEPYDVINSELRAFEERVREDRSINDRKRIYEMPEKYERFSSLPPNH